MVRFLISASICLLAALAAQADLQAGLAAYDAGDYELAHTEWLAAAEAGSVEATFNIGLLHEQGNGVMQDPAEAAGWYLKAAEGGFDRAQYKIAEMYEAGLGVGKDYVQAHKWFTIAGEDRYLDARKRRNRVANRMTPKQIAYSEMCVRQWTRLQKELDKEAKQSAKRKKKGSS